MGDFPPVFFYRKFSENIFEFKKKYLHSHNRYAIIILKEKGVAAIGLEIKTVFSGYGT